MAPRKNAAKDEPEQTEAPASAPADEFKPITGPVNPPEPDEMGQPEPPVPPVNPPEPVDLDATVTIDNRTRDGRQVPVNPSEAEGE